MCDISLVAILNPQSQESVPPSPNFTPIPVGTILINWNVVESQPFLNNNYINVSNGYFSFLVEGSYVIYSHVIFQALAANELDGILQIYKVSKNNVFERIGLAGNNGPLTIPTFITASAVVELNVGDRIFVSVAQNNFGNTNAQITEARISIGRLRRAVLNNI